MSTAPDPSAPRNTLEAFTYTCKAALAAVAAYWLCGLISEPVAIWAAVSALIVIQPSLHPSLRASVVRVIANAIAGVVGGVLTMLLGGHLLVSFALGIMIVGMIVHHLKLDEGLRAAYAAVAIITLTSPAAGWHGAGHRVMAVIFGCLCAVAVNVLFDKLTPRRGDENISSPDSAVE